MVPRLVDIAGFVDNHYFKFLFIMIKYQPLWHLHSIEFMFHNLYITSELPACIQSFFFLCTKLSNQGFFKNRLILSFQILFNLRTDTGRWYWKTNVRETEGAIKNGQSRETFGTQNTRRRQTKQNTQHNMC